MIGATKGLKFIFLHMDVELLQYHLLRGTPFSIKHVCVNSIFWFSVLFHWPTCLSFHQYYNDLITTAMFCSFFSSVWFKTFKSVKRHLIQFSLCRLRNWRLERGDLPNTAYQCHRPIKPKFPNTQISLLPFI